MKIKTILQASLMMTLAGMCQPQPRAFTPELLAMLRPSPALLPDLTVLAAFYDNPNVTVHLRNAGEAPAPPSVLAVLLLKKTDPDTGQPEAFQFPVPALSPGHMFEKTFNIGNKSFTNNGALAVVVDYKNQVAESNESNNKKNVVVLYLPDLVIQSVEITNDTATVYVFNKCMAGAGPAKFAMIIYKGNDKKSGPESVVEEDVPPLAGKTGAKIFIDYKKHFFGSFPINGLNSRYVRLEVDLTNQIKETAESNNWWETGAAPFPDPANSCDPPK